MTKRNYNIDILRAMSILLIVLYHSWVLSGSAAVICAPITMLVSMGGEIGVTAFFALSGYGIFCSLRNSDLNGGISFTTFMKKRFARICLQYVCLHSVLFYSNGRGFIQLVRLKNFVAHIFFVHNFFPELSWSHQWRTVDNGGNCAVLFCCNSLVLRSEKVER